MVIAHGVVVMVLGGGDNEKTRNKEIREEKPKFTKTKKKTVNPGTHF